MLDVVLQAVDAWIVGGLSEAGVVGQDHAEAIDPAPGEVDTVPGAAAVQEYQRLTLAGGIHDGFATIDHINITVEIGMIDSRVAEAIVGHYGLLCACGLVTQSRSGELDRHLSLDRGGAPSW
ncbi:hypothetical protein D9M70_623680 [compost metagenome]